MITRILNIMFYDVTNLKLNTLCPSKKALSDREQHGTKSWIHVGFLLNKIHHQEKVLGSW